MISASCWIDTQRPCSPAVLQSCSDGQRETVRSTSTRLTVSRRLRPASPASPRTPGRPQSSKPPSSPSSTGLSIASTSFGSSGGAVADDADAGMMMRAADIAVAVRIFRMAILKSWPPADVPGGFAHPDRCCVTHASVAGNALDIQVQRPHIAASWAEVSDATRIRTSRAVHSRISATRACRPAATAGPTRSVSPRIPNSGYVVTQILTRRNPVRCCGARRRVIRSW